YFEGNIENLSKIRTELKGNTLNIYAPKLRKSKKTTIIHLTVDKLHSLKTYGSVKIETFANINLSSTDITLSKESSLELFVTSNHFRCNLYGDAPVIIAGDIKELDLNVYGNTSLKLELETKSLSCNIYDFSSIEITDKSTIYHTQVTDYSAMQSINEPAKASIRKNSEVCFYVLRD
ncbi:MAG: hypothetical protein C0594_07050, partial [Marinilabiliales bacterium]